MISAYPKISRNYAIALSDRKRNGRFSWDPTTTSVCNCANTGDSSSPKKRDYRVSPKPQASTHPTCPHGTRTATGHQSLVATPNEVSSQRAHAHSYRSLCRHRKRKGMGAHVPRPVPSRGGTPTEGIRRASGGNLPRRDSHNRRLVPDGSLQPVRRPAYSTSLGTREVLRRMQHELQGQNIRHLCSQRDSYEETQRGLESTKGVPPKERQKPTDVRPLPRARILQCQVWRGGGSRPPF
jgi:hypothetical protein